MEIYFNIIECLIKLKITYNNNPYSELLHDLEFKLKNSYNSLRINFQAKDINEEDLLVYFYYNMTMYYSKGYINETINFINQVIKLDMYYSSKRVNIFILVLKLKVLYAICMEINHIHSNNYNFFFQIQSALKVLNMYDEITLKINMIIADIHYSNFEYQKCFDTLNNCSKILNLISSSGAYLSKYSELEFMVNLKLFALSLEFKTLNECEESKHKIKYCLNKISSEDSNQTLSPLMSYMILIYNNNLEVYKYHFNRSKGAKAKLDEISITLYSLEELLSDNSIKSLLNEGNFLIKSYIKNNLSCSFFLNDNFKECKYLLAEILNSNPSNFSYYLANWNIQNQLDSIENSKVRDLGMKLELTSYKTFSEFKIEPGIFAFLYSRIVNKIANCFSSGEDQVKRASMEINQCLTIIRNFYSYFKLYPYKSSEMIILYFKTIYVDAYLMYVRNDYTQAIKLIEGFLKENLNDNRSEASQEIMLKLLKLRADSWFKIDYLKAIENYNLVLKMYTEFKFKPTLEKGVILNNIGLCHLKYNNIPRAKEYLYAARQFLNTEDLDCYEVVVKRKVSYIDEMLDKLN